MVVSCSLELGGFVRVVRVTGRLPGSEVIHYGRKLAVLASQSSRLFGLSVACLFHFIASSEATMAHDRFDQVGALRC